MLARPWSLLLCVGVAFAARASALEFLEPAELTEGEGQLPVWSVGDQVDVRWESEFERTTLRVFQERAEGGLEESLLAVNRSRDENEVTWLVTALAATRLGEPFHFRLQNGDDGDCNGCALNSSFFSVEQMIPPSLVSSTSTSSAPTASATSSATDDSLGADAASETYASSNSQDEDSGTDLAVPLGVGLGVGIPALIAAVVLLSLLTRRKKKRRRNTLPRGSRAIDAEAAADAGVDPFATPLAEKHSFSSNFRPTYVRTSQGSRMSHTSWIDPFEFERPESAYSDSINQLRRSIYSSRRPSFSSLGDIPEVPQPPHIHRKEPDGDSERWPLP